jgi:Uma2 family endonuclease
MNIPVRKPWTQQAFLSWAQTQEVRYEFDGSEPVAMTGGTNSASAIGTNLLTALRTRLRGSLCRPLGPDAGIETVNAAIRYPDALVTCSKFDLRDRNVPGVIVVFEVVSSSFSGRDRITKVREYAAVPSIRRYVLLESSSIGLTALERETPDQAWRTTVLTETDILRMPEIDIEIPVSAIYEDIAFSDQPQDDETV